MKKIKVIYTGGTIGMIKSDEGVYVPFSVDNLLSFVPEANQLGVELIIDSFEEPLDSAFVGPSEWNEIASRIFEDYNEFDGFVILHGTDTMAYTSSALSFMLKGIDKPVILTGSQIPICEEGTDGIGNFINSIKIAKEGLVNEVAIWFDKTLFRGANVSKIDTADFDGFASLNHPVLATLGNELKYNKDVGFLDKKELVFKKCKKVSVKVLDLSPGVSIEAEAEQIRNYSYAGIVLKTFGTGTTRMQEGDALFEVISDQKIPVIAISECLKGGVEIGKYEAGSVLSKLEVISGEKMTKEAALTKLIIGCSNFEGAELIDFLKENQVREF